jgi:hypothetical protein
METSTTTNIHIPYPDAADLHLRITVGACRLRIVPGDGSEWVSGTYADPSGVLPLRIEQEGSTARIAQTYKWPDTWNVIDRPPTLDLALGKAKTYALTLEIGAHESAIDLGGVPIGRLVIKHGAGKLDLDFSLPNPQPMALLSIAAGAAGLTARNLANANFSEMSAEGGAAAYNFDFGGALRRDARVKVTAGMASVDLHVPATTAARIGTETVLGGVNVGDGFTKQDQTFQTPAALAGTGPVLTVHASVTMGSLRLFRGQE